MSPEALTVYNPSDPNSNIHGMANVDGTPTCRTIDGNMCTGCCMALYITHNSQSDGIVLKEAGNMCEAQAPNQGCLHVLNNEPDRRFPVCPIYHCSGDLAKFRNTNLPLQVRRSAFQRLNLCNVAALHTGEISQNNYVVNQRAHIGEWPEE